MFSFEKNFSNIRKLISYYKKRATYKKTKCEDALKYSDSKKNKSMVIALADGVGSNWDDNIDPSIYSKKLVQE